MRHPHERLLQLQFLTLLLAIVFGIITVFSGYIFLAYVTCLMLAVNLLCEGLIEWKNHDTIQFAYHVLRVILILVFVSYLYFT
ncbi:MULTISPECIES: hypothetical protein [Paraliobacillus]|nr:MULTISPECIES: hypothetical protein [Paraliobacillus]